MLLAASAICPILPSWADENLTGVAASVEITPVKRTPEIVGPSWAVTTMPQLGQLAGESPKQQHIVDHSFIRDINGEWRLWACIRGTSVSRLLFGWQGNSLQDGPWQETGVAMRADANAGEKSSEKEEKIGAPHFQRTGDTWHCFYHSNGMHHAVSDDGINFTRKIRSDGTSRCGIPGGRDVMILAHENRYYSYATVTASRDRSYVIGSESTDLENWSPGKIVREGGKGGRGAVASESPFVVALDGYFYLFRASSHDFKTYVYRSTDPLHFGINDDTHLITELPVKAPEILLDGDKWYISDLANFQGIRLSSLAWKTDK